MTTLPQDLTAEALLKWQDDMEANLERALLANTERALSEVVNQALAGDLTAASARFLWEEAVNQTVEGLGMGVDRHLLEDLLEEDLGSGIYETVQQVVSLRLPQDELQEALLEALDIKGSLVASGVSDLDLEEEVEATFKGWLNEKGENWVEQTGTGHLPKYIRAIADALMRRGFTQQHAIATAVNTVKRWARGGTAAKGAKHGKGAGHVSAKTQAKAIAALVEWEAKKIEARATALYHPKKSSMEDKTLEWHPQYLALEEAMEFSMLTDLARPVLKWKNRIKRAVRTGFTGVVGRLTLTEMRYRGMRTKVWVSKRDDRVRVTHREADGQIVPIDQPFRVGNENLMYPGEHGKAIEEIANCRCIIVPG